MTKRRWLRWAIILICAYLIVTTTRSIVEFWKAGDKITTREDQLNQLNKQNKQLLAEKARVESADYMEKVAREQLGLSKLGEQIVIIPEDLLKAQLAIASTEARPNWQKWWKLWF